MYIRLIKKLEKNLNKAVFLIIFLSIMGCASRGPKLTDEELLEKRISETDQEKLLALIKENNKSNQEITIKGTTTITDVTSTTNRYELYSSSESVLKLILFDKSGEKKEGELLWKGGVLIASVKANNKALFITITDERKADRFLQSRKVFIPLSLHLLVNILRGDLFFLDLKKWKVMFFKFDRETKQWVIALNSMDNLYSIKAFFTDQSYQIAKIEILKIRQERYPVVINYQNVKDYGAAGKVPSEMKMEYKKFIVSVVKEQIEPTAQHEYIIKKPVKATSIVID